MSLHTAVTRYRRGRGVLSRDSDLHVVLLPTMPQRDFVLLGGGGAAIWRLLDTPLTADEIAECFDWTTSRYKTELIGCLRDMVDQGVLDLEDPT